jgi:hypothetical protein
LMFRERPKILSIGRRIHLLCGNHNTEFWQVNYLRLLESQLYTSPAVKDALQIGKFGS